MLTRLSINIFDLRLAHFDVPLKPLIAKDLSRHPIDANRRMDPKKWRARPCNIRANKISAKIPLQDLSQEHYARSRPRSRYRNNIYHYHHNGKYYYSPRRLGQYGHIRICEYACMAIGEYEQSSFRCSAL